MAAHVLMLAALAATAPPDDRAIGSSVSYVFATELGSGIYELSGRTLQVYRIPLSRELRPPREGAPGIRVIAPLTMGFFDFEPRDVLSSGIPTRVDSFSITPGLELEYELSARWRVVPYLRFGASFASSSVDSMLYGLGVRSDYDRPVGEWALLLRNELALAGVDFRADVPDDLFARVRSAVELRRGTGYRLRNRELEIGVYGVLDAIVDPPAAPLAGAEPEPLQLEPGVIFGTRPGWRVWRVPLPRIGLGYRFAGDLSGWRLVIGAPY